MNVISLVMSARVVLGHVLVSRWRGRWFETGYTLSVRTCVGAQEKYSDV